MIFSKKTTKNQKSEVEKQEASIKRSINNPKKVRVTEIKPGIDTFAKIRVIGIGGSGGSAINRMMHDEIRGVEFLAVNTDAQALQQNKAPTKLHIGQQITRGLGAGMNPELGSKAAEESREEIKTRLSGADMVFITCGLGGGTGTGASPVLAQIAREEIGALTVAVVTKPFTFEGAQRKSIAEKGYQDLAKRVDAIITIQNDRLLQIIDKKTSLLDAFQVADDVLKQGVQGVSELITVPGLINLDFNDVKAIMQGAGSALMGIGRASGESRAQEAAKSAIDSPLLELSVDGAKGILFAVAGGKDLTMHEINEAAQIITKSSDPNAKVIFGAIVDENLGDEIRVTVVATGFATEEDSFSSREQVERKRIVPGQNKELSVEDQNQEGNFTVANLERSAFKRRNTKINQPEEENDELEIPAFIRKRMSEDQ